MDLSKYTKMGKRPYTGFSRVQKRCLECGKTLEDNGTHLFLQSFCSQQCKDKYIESAQQ